jgi:hypothetical protein
MTKISRKKEILHHQIMMMKKRILLQVRTVMIVCGESSELWRGMIPIGKHKENEINPLDFVSGQTSKLFWSREDRFSLSRRSVSRSELGEASNLLGHR